MRGLDLKGLHARWKGVFRHEAPTHVPRHLLFGVLAYRMQVERSGDLNPETRQVLDRIVENESRIVVADRLSTFDQRRAKLEPGAILVREWKGRPQRVVVMANGFSWNGKAYVSLSKIAFAITGTKWNGPRFFGLREKKEQIRVERGRS